ncbi:unnamed protein product [Ilex paraguariensis]|uniref:Uncharacterized protein n=1 Tax=Ilex paraguariensis TaxID=185542 RepID=A0ABC8QT01_9AQUA
MFPFSCITPSSISVTFEGPVDSKDKSPPHKEVVDLEEDDSPLALVRADKANSQKTELPTYPEAMPTEMVPKKGNRKKVIKRKRVPHRLRLAPQVEPMANAWEFEGDPQDLRRLLRLCDEPNKLEIRVALDGKCSMRNYKELVTPKNLARLELDPYILSKLPAIDEDNPHVEKTFSDKSTLLFLFFIW